VTTTVWASFDDLIEKVEVSSLGGKVSMPLAPRNLKR
jgi:hypothetical protein